MSHHNGQTNHKSVAAWHSFADAGNRHMVISANPAGIPSVFGKRASGARPLLSWEERVSLSLLVNAAIFYEHEQEDIELWLRGELWINCAVNGTRPVSFSDACHTLDLIDPSDIVRIINFIRWSERGPRFARVLGLNLTPIPFLGLTA